MINFLFVYDDWALLFLRIVLGVILIAHGWPKIKNLRGTADNFEIMGFKPGILWGTIVAFVEFFGGIALITGLFTQLAAALVAVQFVVAIFKVKLQKGLVDGYEFDLLILATALALLALGAGIYSLDEYFYPATLLY